VILRYATPRVILKRSKESGGVAPLEDDTRFAFVKLNDFEKSESPEETYSALGLKVAQTVSALVTAELGPTAILFALQ